ncbi:MAG: hypothetical protein HMLKMBBP_03547 [Planctomycetes bacterium]|nr:hypothetical protein [Planctomycetota bacterium]
MDWPAELLAFAPHAAAAAAFAAALSLAPVRSRIASWRDAAAGWSRWRAAILVVVAIVSVRAALMASFEPHFSHDVEEYVTKAEAILRDGHPRNAERNAAGTLFYRPQGMSLALAGWYLVTGTAGLASARVFGIACAAVCGLAILSLGRALRRDGEARLAALAYAALLPHAVFAVIPYTETFATMLVVAASAAFERVRRGEAGLRGALAFGFLLGWVGITRTELVVLLPAGFAAWFACWRPQRVRAAVLSAVAAAACAVPFAVNHSLRDGYPGTLRTSVQSGLILYFGNNPIEVNGYGNASPPVVARVREMYAEDPTGGAAADAALAWIREHPGEAAANAPKKAWHLWLGRPQGFGWHAARGAPEGLARGASRVLESLAWAQSLALLGLGVFALAATLRRDAAFRWWRWSLLAHLAVWCALATSARNRYPLEPWLLLAAAMHVTARVSATGSPRETRDLT